VRGDAAVGVSDADELGDFALTVGERVEAGGGSNGLTAALAGDAAAEAAKLASGVVTEAPGFAMHEGRLGGSACAVVAR
jgi:hypothetical protein